MKMRRFLVSTWFAGALFAAPAFAGDPASQKDPAAGMSAQEKAMMEAYMKAATPGPMHELLKSGIGHWELTITNWMAPGAPPQTSKATSDRRLAFGGRFVIEEAKGESVVPGQPPFEGMGISGYDNVSKKFFSTWMDNMGTGIMTSTGTYDASAKSWSYTGTYNDPLIGKAKTIRMVIKETDPSHATLEMFDKAPDGKEFKSMQIQYVKK